MNLLLFMKSALNTLFKRGFTQNINTKMTSVIFELMEDKIQTPKTPSQMATTMKIGCESCD